MVGKRRRPVARVWSDHQQRVGRVEQNQNQRQFLQMVRREWDRYTTAQQDALRDALNAADWAKQDVVAADGLVETSANDKAVKHEDKILAGEEQVDARQAYILALDALIRVEEEANTHIDAIQYDVDRYDQARTDQPPMIKKLNKERNDAYPDNRERKSARLQTQQTTMPKRHEHPWQAWRKVGSGGQGVVGLYLKHDENGNITDRIAVKDTYHDVLQSQWYSKLLWDGDVHDAAVKKPKEVTAMQMLRGRTDKIVRLRSWRLFNAKMMYRLYLEYCAHGDLSDVHRHYAQAVVDIPEPAIWHMFESLVEAGIVMEQGNLHHVRNKWEVLVHTDIKPANVFLSAPSDTSYAQYPTPKLGDFGSVVRTTAKDPDNPGSYMNRGTEGVRAPEQIRKVDADTYDGAMDDIDQDSDLDPWSVDDWELTTKTNVFGIGITIMMMMCRGQWLGDVLDYKSRGTRAPELTVWADGMYSEELKDLVNRCVAYKPVDRIGFQELLGEIRDHTGAPGAQGVDLAHGMRARAADDNDGIDPDHFWTYPDEKYAMNALLMAAEERQVVVDDDDGYSPVVSST